MQNTCFEKYLSPNIPSFSLLNRKLNISLHFCPFVTTCSWLITKSCWFCFKKIVVLYPYIVVLYPLTVWITANCGKFLERWEYQTTLTAWEICMQVKKQVRTRHGTTDWFQIRKGVHQGCILSLCLFNLYAHILQNARFDEAQTEIKIARRNINNLRYVMTPPLRQKIKELKILLMKVKEES